MGETVSLYLPECVLVRLRLEKNQSQTAAAALEAYYAERDANEERLARIEEKLDRLIAGGVVVGEARQNDDEVDASAIDEAMAGW